MKKRKLNYKLMLEDIDKLVNNEWGFEIDSKLGMGRKQGLRWTQKEADEMAEILMKIYEISHQIACNAHGSKYLLDSKTIL